MEEVPRIALITGASRGIGRAIAIRLAKAGHKIAINYNSHKEDAEEVLDQIQKVGSDGIIIKGDVSKLNEVQNMVKEVEGKLGNIDKNLIQPCDKILNVLEKEMEVIED